MAIIITTVGNGVNFNNTLCGKEGWILSTNGNQSQVTLSNKVTGVSGTAPVTEVEIDESTFESYQELQEALGSVLFKAGGSGPGPEWGGITGNIEDQEDLINLINSSGGNLTTGVGSPESTPDNPNSIYINEENWDLYKWNPETEEWDLKMGGGTGTFGIVSENPVNAPEDYEPWVVLNTVTGVLWYYNGETWETLGLLGGVLRYAEDFFDLIPPTDRQIPDMGAVKGYVDPLLAGKVNSSGTKTIAGLTTFSSDVTVNGPLLVSNNALQFTSAYSSSTIPHAQVCRKGNHIAIVSHNVYRYALLNTVPLTADRTFTFPDKTGTFALTSDIHFTEAQKNAVNALVSPETDYADMAEATAAIKSIIDALKAV